MSIIRLCVRMEGKKMTIHSCPFQHIIQRGWNCVTIRLPPVPLLFESRAIFPATPRRNPIFWSVVHALGAFYANWFKSVQGLLNSDNNRFHISDRWEYNFICITLQLYNCLILRLRSSRKSILRRFIQLTYSYIWRTI